MAYRSCDIVRCNKTTPQNGYNRCQSSAAPSLTENGRPVVMSRGPKELTLVCDIKLVTGGGTSVFLFSFHLTPHLGNYLGKFEFKSKSLPSLLGNRETFRQQHNTRLFD